MPHPLRTDEGRFWLTFYAVVLVVAVVLVAFAVGISRSRDSQIGHNQGVQRWCVTHANAASVNEFKLWCSWLNCDLGGSDDPVHRCTAPKQAPEAP